MPIISNFPSGDSLYRKVVAAGYEGTEAEFDTLLANTSATCTFTIPAGRMSGDVDGDGVLTQADAMLITDHIAGYITLTGVQEECADIDQDGDPSSDDSVTISQIILGREKAGARMRDVLGIWANNPNYATEDGQFYTDISVPIVKEGDSMVIVLPTPTTDITKAVYINGKIRVYAKWIPIAPIPALAYIHSDGLGNIVIVSAAQAGGCLPLSGGSMTGTIIAPENGKFVERPNFFANDNQVTGLKFENNKVTMYIATEDGETVESASLGSTGLTTTVVEPTTDAMPTPKSYVDTAMQGYLPLSGGELTGELTV